MAETKISSKIAVWRLLLFCVIAFCSVSIWITITFPENIFDLFFYFSYMTIACTFIPLPTPQVAMDYGQRFNPILIAVLGGIGFCISASIDYSLVTLLFRSERIAKIKGTRTYLRVKRFFNKYPFITLTVAAFTPIPLEPIKLTACASQYNIVKYLLACFVGRTPRYYILAELQREFLNIPRIYLYLSIVVIVMGEIVRRLLKRRKKCIL